MVYYKKQVFYVRGISLLKQIKNLQIGLIILAFLITAGGLFGGQFLTNKFRVEKPLHQELQRIKAIRNFQVKTEKDGVNVTLKLRKVGNLQQVVENIQQKVFSYYNQPIKMLRINDNRNHYLEDLRYQLSFYLQEAAVSGHYIQLKTALESYSGVKAKVYFGPDSMYLQLEKGANYLYEVVPIVAQVVTHNNPSGGDTV
jgi:predicted RND superfamily exporter protein